MRHGPSASPSIASGPIVFAFIVTSEVKRPSGCIRNDIITTMVTRRTASGGASRRPPHNTRVNRHVAQSSHARGGSARTVRPSGGPGRAPKRAPGAHAAPRTSSKANKASLRTAAARGSASGRGGRLGGREAGTYVGASTPQSLSGTPGLAGIGLGGGSASAGKAPRPTAQDNGQTLLTRRQLLLGAAGVGAAVVIGGAAAAAISSQSNSTPAIETLQVPTGSVTAATTLSQVDDASECLSQTGEYDLDYGTLVFCSDDAVAACLLPTEKAKPLARIGMLSLSSGTCTTVVKAAQGQDDGFEIYDVRATSQGIVWTEANILDGVWRIYAAKLNGAADAASNIQKLDEGSCGEYETPGIAAVGGYAFWQVMSQYDANASSSSQTYALKRASFGSANAETVFEGTGRAACAPYAAEDGVVIAPRNPQSTSYYQLTRVGADGNVEESLTLPSSMKPLEAAYGKTGFAFAFDATYSTGGGIANLGTYTPASKPSGQGADAYSNAKWVRFDRTPTCAPAWCGNYLMVKSTKAVCGVDAAGGRYFVLDVANGADDYGEWIASSGSRSTFVTFTNINYTPVSGDAVKCCRVKVWKAN